MSLEIYEPGGRAPYVCELGELDSRHGHPEESLVLAKLSRR